MDTSEVASWCNFSSCNASSVELDLNADLLVLLEIFQHINTYQNTKFKYNIP